MSALDFDARIHGEQLENDIANINRRITQLTNSISKEGSKIDDVFRKVGMGLGAYFGGQQLASFATQVANIRGEFQDLQTSFETILKSKDKADKLMSQVVSFAATTPFNLRDVAAGTKQLLAYGFAAEDIVGNLRMLGDVAAGTGTNIGDLIYLYGTLQTQGRAYTRDIMQFTSRGIPIIGELAKNLGVAKDQVQDLVEAGRVGFPEVEKAFKSMAGEGGIFGGLMEKQSKNIRGQYSNLVDLIDQMKNRIGESNQEMIVGSIKFASTVVKNYEAIGKVILSLVATYGAYKAALIATAALQSAKIFAENIQLVMMFRKELGLLTAAQQAFNITASMNPYVAAIAGVTALASIIMIFADKAETTKDVIDRMNQSIEQIGKQVEVDALIAKYEDLKKNAGDSTEKQKELNDTIQQLANIFPDAVSGTDKYGNAIDLVSEKIANNNNKLKDFLKLTAGDEIKNAQERIADLSAKRDELLDDINSGYQKTSLQARGYKAENRLLSPDEIVNLKTKVKELTTEIENLYQSVDKNQKEMLKLDAADAELSLAPYKELFKAVTEYSKEQALDARDKLIQLYGTMGANADKVIQKQAQALNDYANGLKTVKERISEAQQTLAEGKKKLEQMLLPNSTASQKEIENQRALIKTQEDNLEILTGVKKSDSKKQVEIEKNKLEALQELANKELQITLDLQQGKIDAMNEGLAKQNALIELSYAKELQDIEKQKQEYLKTINKSKGYEINDPNYITKLPAETQTLFDNMVVEARNKRNKRLIELDEKMLAEDKQIWDEATAAFVSNTELEIRAINDKYNKLIERARENGALQAEIDRLNVLRQREIDKANKDAILSLSPFYQKLYGDIEKYGITALTKLQKQAKEVIESAKSTTEDGQTIVLVDISSVNAQGQAVKKTIRMTLDEFNQFKGQVANITNKIAEKNPFIAVKDSFKDLLKAFKEGDNETIESAFTTFSENAKLAIRDVEELADAIGGDLGGTISSITAVADKILSIGDGIANKNFVQVASGVIGLSKQLYDAAMDTSKIEADLAKPWKEMEQWIAASNRGLEQYIKLRDNAIGQETYSAYDKVIQETKSRIEDEKKLLEQMKLSFTLEGKGWFGNAYNDVEKQIDAISKKLGGGKLELEGRMREFGVGFWESVKGVFTYDINQLLYDNVGNFTLDKINELINNGAITDKNLIEAVDNYNNLLDKLNDAEKQKQELLTATTEANITDAIINGFRNGQSSMEDFAKTFEDLMKDAMLNVMKTSYLEPEIAKWVAQFESAMSDQRLTDQETKDLRDLWNSIIKGGNDYMSAMNGVTQTLSQKTDSQLTGAVKGMTQESAELLAGQVMGIREYQVKSFMQATEMLDAINTQSVHLGKIVDNTGKTTNELKEVNTKLETLNQLVSKL